MNRIFRLVRNRSTGVWQAVAETGSGHGSGTGIVRSALAVALVVGSGWAAAQNLPSGGHIVGGSGSISQNGQTLTITQDSPRLATDWTSFNIGKGHTVQFVQPSASAAALNRVVGNDVSTIQGALKANGQVFLVNPNGVLFTQSAQVDVGALVASTLSIATDDFMAGRLRFEGDSRAAVVNQGHLHAAEGGSVALVAARIENVGEIAAPGGQVLLGAGRKVLVDLGGPVRLEVQEAAVDALIEQGGAVRADGGTVLMHARSAQNLTATVINHRGVTEARSLVAGQDGKVSLLGEGGIVEVAGTIDASSPGGRGGAIVATGGRVLLESSAVLNASGAAGGGTVHAGGGWQGKDATISNAADTIVRAGATLRADAGETGDGGTVVVWSDGGTHFAGRISAKGGLSSGNGGQVEVSGKQALGFTGEVDTSASVGRSGLLLLDPNTLTVVNGSSAQTGTPVDWANQSNSINYTIPETVLEAMTGDVVLTAITDIIINNLADNVLNLSATNMYFYANDESSPSSSGGFTMRDVNDVIRLNQGAGSRIVFQGGAVSSRNTSANSNSAYSSASIFLANVETQGADVVFNTKRSGAAAPIIVQGSITTNGGSITVAPGTRFGLTNSNAVDVQLNGAVSTGGGSFTSNMVGTVAINGGLALGSGTATFGGTGTQLNSLLTSSGNLSIASPLSFGAGAGISTPGTITFDSAASMRAGGSLTLTASDFVFNNAFSGNGASITLRPSDPAANVDIGTAGSGTMLISQSALGQLNGFSTLTIGRTDATGTTRVLSDVSVAAANRIELINRNIDVIAGGLENTSGGVVLTGDVVNLGNRITSSAGRPATIRPLDPVTGLVLNALGGASVTTDVLEVGSGSGPDVTLNADINTTAHTVYVRSAGNVTATAGGISTANLAVSAGGTVTLTDDSFDFTRLALRAGGDVHARSSNAFEVGTVQGLTGIDVGNHGLILETTGIGTVTASQSIRAGALQLLGPQASFDLSGALHGVGQLDVMAGGTLSFGNLFALTLGGISTAGDMDIATQQGDLTLSGQLTTQSSSDRAVVLNAGRSHAALDAAGGDIVLGNGAAIGMGAGGRATLYTGSLTGGAPLAAWAGAGRSRYASDEVQTGYDVSTAGLNAGMYAVYREQPVLDVTALQATAVYGDALPSFGASVAGLVHGDTDAQVRGAAQFSLQGAVVSGAGHAVVGTHDVAYQTGLASGLGYGFRDAPASSGELTVTPRALALSNVGVEEKIYDGTDAATVRGGALGGQLAGDALGFTLGSARFVDAQAGAGKSVQVAAALTGADAGNYTVAAPSAVTGTITPRSITVTADSGAKVYGDADPALGWRLTNGSLIGSDTLSGGVTRAAGENIGTYAVSGSTLSNSNYNIQLVGGVLTVTPRTITVTADSASKRAGQGDPALGWNVTQGNLVGGDTLQVNVSRDAGEAPGSYVVGASAQPNANYTVTTIDGVLTIVEAATTGAADAIANAQGQAANLAIVRSVAPMGIQTSSSVGFATSEAGTALELVPLSGDAPPPAATAKSRLGPVQVYVVGNGLRLPDALQGSQPEAPAVQDSRSTR